MSGTFAVKEDDSFVTPGKQVTFGLGEVIEGHISVVLSAVEDPDLHQTLVPGELKLELLRNGSVFLTSGQLTASVVNDSTSVWQVRLTSNIHTRNVLFHIWIEYPVPDAAAHDLPKAPSRGLSAGQWGDRIVEQIHLSCTAQALWCLVV